MTDEEIEATRDAYIDVLKPVFLPDDPVRDNIVNYFASLLRVLGMEDKGWDPYLESRGILEDLNSIMQTELPEEEFDDQDLTKWRLGLLMYSHIVEMDAPYEVLTNLLRHQLGHGYSPVPFYKFLTKKQKKKFSPSRFYPRQKIEIIKMLSGEAGIPVGDLFDDFYKGDLRNAISHSDFIITDEAFRSRSGPGALQAFSISLKDLNEIITKAKIFISTFFSLEAKAREVWGQRKHEAIKYDPAYKGLIEVLVDDDDLMCGFKIHWPNNSESTYRRTEDGVEMINCMVDLKHATVEFMVGLYARERDDFSPLVEKGEEPVYTKLEGTGDVPTWDLE